MRGKGNPCVLAVCGWKGSGKTALIEQLAAELTGRGLRVLAVKGAGRALELEPKGRDSVRMFRAGADVYAYDAGQRVLRRHGRGPFSEALASLAPDYDVVLVEGQKRGNLPKLWLLREGERDPPEGVAGVRACLAPGPGRLAAALRVVEAELQGH